MAKVVHGVILGLAGISLFIVSIWLLVDTENPKLRGLHLDRGYSPKLGVAASGLLVILGALCCFVNKTNLRRTLILIGVFVALVLTVSCFGIAVKNRLDLNDVSKELRALLSSIKGKHGTRQNYKINTSDPEEIFTKMKTQLVVMAVIAGLDVIVEIVSLITAYKWKDRYP